MYEQEIEIKDRIKELRQKHNLTLSAFGERIGMTKGNLSKIENGMVYPRIDIQDKICEEFKVTRTWLNGANTEPELNPILDRKLIEIKSAMRNMSEEEQDAILKKFIDFIKWEKMNQS